MFGGCDCRALTVVIQAISPILRLPVVMRCSVQNVNEGILDRLQSILGIVLENSHLDSRSGMAGACSMKTPASALEFRWEFSIVNG